MKSYQTVIVLLLPLLICVGSVSAGEGGGSVSLGYVMIDEEGDQSSYYRSFNDHEGVSVSLEDMRYRFGSGVRMTADLRNLTLNNRNLQTGIAKPGRFGLDFTSSQYRRAYSFEGGSEVKRNRTGGTVWFYPHKTTRIYGGVSEVGRSGESVELFQFGPATSPTEQTRISHDYREIIYHGGVRLTHRGAQFQAEYRTNKYSDDLDTARDQTRHNIRLSAIVPIPQHEEFIIHGGFQRFVTEFDESGFGISSNTGWGGLTVNHKSGLSLRYNVIFNRAGSDSDLVNTDNLTNAAYVSYSRPKFGGATLGYQHDIEDDLEDEVKASSFYLSGWLTPVVGLDLRSSYGNRDEEVKEGVRLIGDEERSRFRASAKYRVSKLGWAAVKFENKKRENSQIGTSVDFVRTLVDGFIRHDQVGTLSIGYAYSKGDYANIDGGGAFEFRDHLVYGDITTQEIRGLSVGFGGTYYRSRRDLDVESFTLRLSGSYRIMGTHLLEVTYNAREFDDYIAVDRNYTSDIIEVSLVKKLTF